MNARVRTLTELVGDSLYAIDERAVAQSIVLRGVLRGAIPDVPLRSDARGPEVRSFRRHDNAVSFRLSLGDRRRPTHL